MPAITAFTILAVIFAFSQIVAQKTKATFSAAFVIAVTLIILFNVNILPRDIYPISTLQPVGGLLIGVLVCGMGNMLDFPELKRQWKTVVIAFIGMSIATAILVFVGQYIVGRDTVLAGAPVFSGGVPAMTVILAALEEGGFTDLLIFPVLMLAIQNFIGLPIASNLLKVAARRFVGDKQLYEQSKSLTMHEEKQNENAKRLPLQMPKSLQMPSVLFAKLCLVTMLAFYVGGFFASITGGIISYVILAMVLGTVFTELGFLERDILPKTDSYGFIIFGVLMVAFASLSNTSPQQILKLLVPLLVCQAIGVLGAVVSGYFLGKAFKTDPFLSIPMVLTCLFGFPSTMLMSNEVAFAIGENEEQVEVIGNHIRPKMVTAGFVSSMLSIAIAGICAGLL